jgi:hypothetical protein
MGSEPEKFTLFLRQLNVLDELEGDKGCSI